MSGRVELRAGSPGERRSIGFGSSSAFTILEVALSAAVLALVLMSAIPVMKRAFSQVDTARSIEVAGNILQCELEKERLFSWAQASDVSYAPAIDNSFNQIPSLAGRFTMTRSVSPVADHASELLLITVTVLWANPEGRTVSRSYTTYYGKNGLYDYYHDKN